MTIQQAKQIDLVDYLNDLGYHPVKISAQNYWYCSPLREEKIASFKVNRSINRWYDFGEGKGGNFVDFGILYYQCNLPDFLQKMQHADSAIKYRDWPVKKELSTGGDQKQIKILSVHEISSYTLIKYLQSRRIPLEIADKYVKEVRYQNGNKTYYALGFKNKAGGYELRNPYFKGGSSPKDFTFIDNGSTNLDVFEGFFNFLSHRTLYYKKEEPLHNFLVLNSTAFFEKSVDKMLEHDRVYLFLDNDRTGQKCTQHALALNREKFHDESHLYRDVGDLNDWMIKNNR